MKTVTIHQPNYLPWIGFFSKISCSDCFVILDNAEYTKNSLINRNRIRIKDGWGYLTIPIDRKFYGTEIHEVTLPRDKKWRETHWKTIKQNYTKSDFFNLHQDFFESLYNSDFDYLWQINEKIISYLLRCFEIDVEVIRASQLDLDPNLRKTDRLIACLRRVGADIYLSGPSGRDYLDFEKFPQNNIDLRFFEFQHPVYKQAYSGFESAMAAIDLLFNLGPQASEIIKTSGSISNSLRVGS